MEVSIREIVSFSFHYNSIPGYGITINFYICYSSISIVPYANLCSKWTKLDRLTGLLLVYIFALVLEWLQSLETSLDYSWWKSEVVISCE